MIKIVMVFCIALFCANTIILESHQTHVSSPVITLDKTSYKHGDKVTISGWVNYNEEPTSDVLLRIIATNPLEVKIFDEYVTSGSDGTFSAEIPITKNAETGNYSVEVISQCREVHREICTHQSETISISIGNDPNQTKKIPDWIKNVAEFWIRGDIDDEGFVQLIEYLVKEEIISIPYAETPKGDSATQIPSWIKTNTEFWIAGDISDDEFTIGIEWLINNGIIKVQDKGGITVSVYEIEGNYYPTVQFSLTPSSPDCSDYHLHATSGYTTDAVLVSFTDHHPGSCGLGKADSLVQHSIVMSENQILKWEQITKIKILE